ncbi:MAG: GNAT family N-acetyltransferase [Candidatus Cohnella colombiensis]|uniref:GNAT family N-acetyltransferase n=1 Tax=Candidatus Cohnella colombiensis TaxID=3121368 RepID=A0AA95EYU3_9BACL|nr:MAG: GNAT family N-acetyltransferase [Cohnella sp.]
MIHYSEEHKLKAVDVAQVFRSSGIKRPVDDLDRIQQMIDQADVLISAWEDDKLIGIARSLTDYCYCCYLSDLAVDKAYQGKGIGKELIHRTQHIIGEQCSLVLISAPDAVSYYPHVGFEQSDRTFIIARKK